MTPNRWVFILHLWLEGEPQNPGFPPSLRGSIQQVGADQTRYFSSLEQATALLVEALNAADDPAAIPQGDEP